jgi:DNA-binding transcriptional LysR family regulator
MTVAALVRAGRAELGLADASASDAGEGVLARPLGQQELLAVCAPGLLRGTRARPLAELAALPLVVTPPGTSTRRVIDAALAAAGVAPTVAVEVDQREAVVPLVLAGAGIAFLPETQASEAGRLGAQVVRPLPVLVRSIVLLHRDRPLSPAGRAFVTLAVGPHDEPRTMGR